MDESQKTIQALTDQLEAAKAQTAELSAKLNEASLEQQLFRKLTEAGASDIESALLLAKNRLKDGGDVDICIRQLRKEKIHLFAPEGSAGVFPARTAGVRSRGDEVTATLAKAAGKAAATGSRKDLQDYLKLRRNYL
jgi:hypothetical protein